MLPTSHAAKLSAHYLLRTSDSSPAYIVVRTSGWRTGPPEILAALQDPAKADDVDPNDYKFRLYIEMETGDERYAELNTGMWIGSGIRKGAQGESRFSRHVACRLPNTCQ